MSAVLAWTLLWLVQGGGPASQLLRAAGVMVTGAFVAGVLWRPERLGRNLAVAVMAGVVGTALWSWLLGLTWNRISFALTRASWETYRAMARGMTLLDSGATTNDAASSIQLAVRLFPGLTALAALAGLLVGWAIYQRVAARPIGAPAGPFTTFRGSDQLLWGLVVPLAVLVAPAPDAWDLLAANVLLVVATIYAVRGAAILTWVMRERSPFGTFAIVLLAVASLFVLPIAGSGLLLLGIVDTWIDIRRRQPPERNRGELR